MARPIPRLPPDTSATRVTPTNVAPARDRAPEAPAVTGPRCRRAPVRRSARRPQRRSSAGGDRGDRPRVTWRHRVVRPLHVERARGQHVTDPGLPSTGTTSTHSPVRRPGQHHHRGEWCTPPARPAQVGERHPAELPAAAPNSAHGRRPGPNTGGGPSWARISTSASTRATAVGGGGATAAPAPRRPRGLREARALPSRCPRAPRRWDGDPPPTSRRRPVDDRPEHRHHRIHRRVDHAPCDQAGAGELADHQVVRVAPPQHPRLEARRADAAWRRPGLPRRRASAHVPAARIDRTARRGSEPAGGQS